MKQTVIDILIYLFEHYFDDELVIDADRDRLQSELRSAGFDSGQVSRAFDWLQGLASQEDAITYGEMEKTGSIRVFTADECVRLDAECRGFLLYLEQAEVLEPRSRELVIDRVMALKPEEIDLEQLKWIILMVLFNLPGHEDSFIWMEGLVLDEATDTLH